ncbi:uncharacterized protein [Centruroides vittatus]|uniref:uncharacterized protein n=1 Tax=Centruroides vittatus TaxID=120091 RepID=UPI00350ED20D
MHLWQGEYTLGIQLPNNIKFNTMLFADDQVVFANSEDNLQKGLFTLNKISKQYSMKISTAKPKIQYESENDINNQLTKFLQILRIINNTLKPHLVQKHSRLKLYKTLAIPTLLYGSKIWVLKKKDIKRLQAAEMRFMRRTAGYTLLDHRRNEDILEELHMRELIEKLFTYRGKWLQRVSRMSPDRIPHAVLQYQPRGRRRPGRPQKRLLDPV